VESLRSKPFDLEDSSDWWSMNNEKEPALPVQPIEKHFDGGHYNILGLSLDMVDSDKITAKLGKVTFVDHGDGANWRRQACYVSVGQSDRVYWVFEFAEGPSSAFDLFRGDANWNGNELCAKSKLVSKTVATTSSLKLGLSRSEVEAILGKPEATSGERIAYCRKFKRTTTRREFEKLRADYGAPSLKRFRGAPTV